MDKKPLYKIMKSNAKFKKYSVYVMKNGKKKKINFGDVRYQHFKDRTPLKLYSKLDHNDKERRKRYLKRAKGIKLKNGKLAYLDKNQPNYYAVKYLW
jgi:hypothetical protein